MEEEGGECINFVFCFFWGGGGECSKEEKSPDFRSSEIGIFALRKIKLAYINIHYTEKGCYR